MLKKLNLFTLGVALILSLSCSKEKEIVDIDENNLTSCGAETCKYRFTEKADVSLSPIVVKSGSYRLFLAEFNTAASEARLYIKAPMGAQQFTLNDKDIRNGKVQYLLMCTSCDYVDVKAVGGYVKGKNLTPDKPSDQTKWILEAEIILQSVSNPNYKHTLYIKQYFSPNFVTN